MPYSDMHEDDLIFLAVEFVGRGQDIPADIANLCSDIMHPEGPDERDHNRAVAGTE